MTNREFETELTKWQHEDKTGVDLIGSGAKLNQASGRMRWEEIQAEWKRQEAEFDRINHGPFEHPVSE